MSRTFVRENFHFQETMLTNRIKKRFKNREDTSEPQAPPAFSQWEDTRPIEELALPASAENLIVSMGKIMRTVEGFKRWLQHPKALQHLQSSLSKETATELEEILKEEDLLPRKR